MGEFGAPFGGGVGGQPFISSLQEEDIGSFLFLLLYLSHKTDHQPAKDEKV